MREKAVSSVFPEASLCKTWENFGNLLLLPDARSGTLARMMDGASFMQSGYGAIAKILHWLIFALLAVQYAIGSIMPHIGRHTADEGWVAWHFSVGAAILFFIVLRLI